MHKMCIIMHKMCIEPGVSVPYRKSCENCIGCPPRLQFDEICTGYYVLSLYLIYIALRWLCECSLHTPLSVSRKSFQPLLSCRSCLHFASEDDLLGAAVGLELFPFHKHVKCVRWEEALQHDNVSQRIGSSLAVGSSQIMTNTLCHYWAR